MGGVIVVVSRQTNLHEEVPFRMKTHILLFPTVAVKNDGLKINIKGWLFTSEIASRRWKLVSAVSRRMLSPSVIPGASSAVDYQQTFTQRTELFSSKPAQAIIRVLIVGRDTSNIHFLQPKKDQDLIDEQEFAKLNEEHLQSGFYPFIDIATDAEGLFEGEIFLTQAQITSITPKDARGDLPFRILAIVIDDVKVNDFGTVPVVENTPAISFISDVDDTIKLSDVFKGMIPAIRTALFHDLADVPGMVFAFFYPRPIHTIYYQPRVSESTMVHRINNLSLCWSLPASSSPGNLSVAI